MRVEKQITLFPQKFKSVVLRVTEVDSFEDADDILRKEVMRFIDTLELEDIEILKRTIGLVI